MPEVLKVINFTTLHFVYYSRCSYTWKPSKLLPRFEIYMPLIHYCCLRHVGISSSTRYSAQATQITNVRVSSFLKWRPEVIQRKFSRYTHTTLSPWLVHYSKVCAVWDEIYAPQIGYTCCSKWMPREPSNREFYRGACHASGCHFSGSGLSQKFPGKAFLGFTVTRPTEATTARQIQIRLRPQYLRK